MSLLRAIFRLFSELTEATTATVDDWLAIQKSGEAQLKKIKPTNLPYAATSHAHGNLTSDGKLGSIANRPVITGTDGAVTTGSFGTSANTFCEGDDSRLSNSRTPTSHSHAIGDLPTTTNNPAALGTATPGNATTVARSNHVHPTTGLLLTTDRGGTPVALGSAAAEGDATTVARSNHVHPYPTAANVGAMATAHAANAITGFGSSATALGASSAGTATTVSRSDHRHAMPTAADVGAAAKNGSASENFQVNQLQNTSGYYYVWDPSQPSSPTDLRNVANFSLGNLSVRMAFRNNQGHNFWTLTSTLAPIYAGDVYSNGVKVTSDIRAKSRVSKAPRTRRSLKALADAGVIRYRMRDESEDAPLRFGFDAEIVHREIPEAATWARIDEDPAAEELQAIDLMAMTAMLVQQVADLEERLERLESSS